MDSAMVTSLSRSLSFLLVVVMAVAVTTTPATAQRRIEGQRIGSGPLNQNPAGRALGSGTVNRPDGILGDGAMTYGNALDANLRVGSGGFNSRSARSDAYTYRNLQARNLVVTNGVTGGRGFRGDVGYLAPGDFAGRTSGDSTYGFRRDSALSGLEFLSSSRQIDTFNIAQGMGVFQYRRDYTALPKVNTTGAVTRIDDAEIRLDRANAAIRTGNLLDTAVAPSNIGLVQAADGEVEQAMSSTVRGIQFPNQAQFQPASIYEQSLFNEANVFGDEAIVDSFRPERFISPLDRDDATDESEADDRLRLDVNDSSRYSAIMKRVAQKYAGRDDVTVDNSSLEGLRDGLGRIDAMVVPTRIGAPGTARKMVPDERREGLPGERRQNSGLGVGPEDGEDDRDFLAPAEGAADEENAEETEADGRRQLTGDEDDDGAPKVRSVEELIQALAHGEEVDSLVDPKMRVRVQQIVTQAETAMREGDFFRAEDRFEVALQLNPGNPMLEGGLANAQIGAGLYRSAGVTLTRLFRDDELMIDVKWEAGLIPNETRLKIAANEIQDTIRKNPRNAGALGLVQAYIGRQLADETMILDGLENLEETKLQRLSELLRAIWLTPAADADR